MTINALWGEGRTFDLWSFNHLLSGIAFASLLSHFPISFGRACVFAVVLFVGWEIVEVVVGIQETLVNIVVDVVLDLSGFLVVAWPVAHYHYQHAWWVTVAILVVFNAFNVWGFRAYRTRTTHERA